MEKIEITVCLSTKNRYDTTLSSCLIGIACQSYKPKKVIIFDDGDHIDLTKNPVYMNIFSLFFTKGIECEVLFGQRKGQVYNHQASIDVCKTDWIWRIDDDDFPESNCLENMVKNIKEGVGAIGPVVLDPKDKLLSSEKCSSSIENIYTHMNIQWSDLKEVKEVDHLNNTFLFRKQSALDAGGYCLDLSPVGHREETLFTYQIKRAGYKVIVDPSAVVWHLRSPTGGIRSYEYSFFWEHDEKVFLEKLKDFGVKINKLVILNCGLGDHFAFKMILPELKNRYNLTLAVCYPDVFKGDTDLNLISIQDALMAEKNIDSHSVYLFMIKNNWKGKISEAFRKMLL